MNSALAGLCVIRFSVLRGNCKKDINIIIVMIIMITIIYYLILKFTLHNNSNAKNVQDVQVLHKGTELAQYEKTAAPSRPIFPLVP